MDEPKESARAFDDGPREPGKKPYHRPELVEYGSVAKLTQGTLTTQSDGRAGGFKKKRNCL